MESDKLLVDDVEILASLSSAESNDVVGVVTVDGATATVVINGMTYTHNDPNREQPYSQDEIQEAIDNSATVAAQGVGPSNFSLSSGKKFVGDQMTMTGGFNSNGIIYNKSGIVELSGSTFFNLRGDFNAGLMNCYTGNATVTNCSFNSNTASFGAAILSNDQSSLFVTDSDFGGNSGIEGGAIVICGVTGSVSGCVFDKNTASKRGGALQTQGTTQAVIVNNTFTNNTGPLGGAIINISSAIVTINGNTFSANIATQGGAIYNTGTTSIFDNTFTENTAGTAGGAIFNASTATVTGSTFAFNTSGSCGGAVFSATTATITFENCIFVENLSRGPESGGAIEGEGDVTLIGCTFSGNTAGWGGGAMYTYRQSIVNVTDSIFVNNSAYWGAALYCDGGTTMISNSTFSDNGVTDDDGGYAGAVYNFGVMTITDNIFTNNVALTVGGAIFNDSNTSTGVIGDMTVSNNIFTGNTSSYGGAIENKGNLFVSGNDFTGNVAIENGEGGGAIYNVGHAEISANTFTGNSSAIGGGATFNEEADMSVSGNTFDGNTAVFGGAIANGGTAYRDASATIDGNIFTGNTTSDGGGAIYNYGAASITGNTFTGNTAFNGGAIDNNGDALVTGNTFIGNTAANYGGAIYHGSGDMTIRDCYFLTVTDTIKAYLVDEEGTNGSITIGGTIWTAANLSSDVKVTVEAETKLVLDLSVYDGTMENELLTDFDSMFGESQNNLTISINVAENQADGTYALATGVSSLAQQDFTVTIGGDPTNSFTVSVGETVEYDDKKYTLKLDDETLSLTVAPSCFPMEDRPVITVLPGATLSEQLHITSLKLLDVKAAGTYEGAILETQNGKANVKIADGGKVQIEELRQHKDGSQTSIAMKNASLVVTNGMSGVAKLATGDGSTVSVGGDIVGTSLGKDKMTIGKNSSLAADSIKLLDGESSIALAGAGSKLDVTGTVSGINSLKIGNGADPNEGAVVAKIGELDLDGAKSNTLSIGKFGIVDIDSMKTMKNIKTTVAIGSNADVKVGSSIGDVAKLTVAAGAKYKDAAKEQHLGVTKFVAGDITGTLANDKLTVGDNSDVNVGSIDFRRGKDTLNIGGKGVVFVASGDINNLSALKVAAGKSATAAEMAKVTIGDIFFDQAANKLDIGAYADFVAKSVTAVEVSKTAVSIGSVAKVSFGNVEKVSSLKVAAGKKNKATGMIDKTSFGVSGTLSGTGNNDTFAFGNDVTATFGGIDMGLGDKDKLTIGKQSVVNAGDILNVEQVTIGDGSTFSIGSESNIAGKITGSAGDNTLVVGAGASIGTLEFGKGKGLDVVDFDCSSVMASGACSIDTCLNTDNITFRIDGQDVGFDQKVTTETYEATLTKNGNQVTLTWDMLA
ncbi:MAG: right-handed parallel beta-helix repeat-containing protein [Victivallaceae bacterium]|nr:right-handed parallel beta-helix repeat-containing protein [Victivallaceae bacterium]